MKGSFFFKWINTNGFKSSCEALACGILTSISWSHEGGEKPSSSTHNKVAGALISESRSLPYAHVQRIGFVQAGRETSDSLGKDLETPEAQFREVSLQTVSGGKRVGVPCPHQRELTDTDLLASLASE